MQLTCLSFIKLAVLLFQRVLRVLFKHLALATNLQEHVCCVCSFYSGVNICLNVCLVRRMLCRNLTRGDPQLFIVRHAELSPTVGGPRPQLVSPPDQGACRQPAVCFQLVSTDAHKDWLLRLLLLLHFAKQGSFWLHLCRTLHCFWVSLDILTFFCGIKMLLS